MVGSPCYKTIEANCVTPLATPSPGTYYNPMLLINGGNHKIPSIPSSGVRPSYPHMRRHRQMQRRRSRYHSCKLQVSRTWARLTHHRHCLTVRNVGLSAQRNGTTTLCMPHGLWTPPLSWDPRHAAASSVCGPTWICESAVCAVYQLRTYVLGRSFGEGGSYGRLALAYTMSAANTKKV